MRRTPNLRILEERSKVTFSGSVPNSLKKRGGNLLQRKFVGECKRCVKKQPVCSGQETGHKGPQSTFGEAIPQESRLGIFA